MGCDSKPHDLGVLKPDLLPAGDKFSRWSIMRKEFSLNDLSSKDLFLSTLIGLGLSDNLKNSESISNIEPAASKFLTLSF
jgi:hypothetical protein